VTRPISAAFARDLASSYAASVARVASWLIVSAVVYRRGGADDLALLMLLRGTVGLLSYASLGLAPALVHLLAVPLPVISIAPAAAKIDYAPSSPVDTRSHRDCVFATAFFLACVICGLACICGFAYAGFVGEVHGLADHNVPPAKQVVGYFVLATVARVVGDLFGARLQASGRIWIDNICLLTGEVTFVLFALADNSEPAADAATAYFAGAAVALAGRLLSASDLRAIDSHNFRSDLVLPLLIGGGAVLLSQLADWFYAPLNQLLIAGYLSIDAVATYVPALQVDAALLLLMAGLTGVLLPNAARAAAVGDRAALRRQFIGGSLVSLVLLTTAAVGVWTLSAALSIVGSAIPCQLPRRSCRSCSCIPCSAASAVSGGPCCSGWGGSSRMRSRQSPAAWRTRFWRSDSSRSLTSVCAAWCWRRLSRSAYGACFGRPGTRCARSTGLRDPRPKQFEPLLRGLRRLAPRNGFVYTLATS
jgi:hypothetical protein